MRRPSRLLRRARWGPALLLLKAAGGDVTGPEGAARSLRYGNAETVRLDPTPYSDLAATGGEYHVPAPHVRVYEDARLLGREDPLGLTSGGRPIRGVGRSYEFDTLRQLRLTGEAYGWPAVAAELFVPDRSPLATDVSLDTVVPFTRRKPHVNYYHWVTEQLPRVRGIEAYAERSGRTPDVLVESDPPAWVTELLDLVGLPAERRVEWTHDKATVARLVVPRYTRKSDTGVYRPSRADLRWVRERLRSAAAAVDSPGPTRLFVSRADADGRRVTNRDEVTDALSEYGVVPVVPTEFTVAQQVALFRDADVVVGPHGAGLTNLLFAGDATVVELLPADYTKGYFHVLCDLFDLEYHHVVGGPATPDFAVPVDRLRAVLESTGVDRDDGT